MRETKTTRHVDFINYWHWRMPSCSTFGTAEHKSFVREPSYADKQNTRPHVAPALLLARHHGTGTGLGRAIGPEP